MRGRSEVDERSATASAANRARALRPGHAAGVRAPRERGRRACCRTGAPLSTDGLGAESGSTETRGDRPAQRVGSSGSSTESSPTLVRSRDEDVDGIVTQSRADLVDCMRNLPLDESMPIADSALRCDDIHSDPAGHRARRSTRGHMDRAGSVSLTQRRHGKPANPSSPCCGAADHAASPRAHRRRLSSRCKLPWHADASCISTSATRSRDRDRGGELRVAWRVRGAHEGLPALQRRSAPPRLAGDPLQLVPLMCTPVVRSPDAAGRGGIQHTNMRMSRERRERHTTPVVTRHSHVRLRASAPPQAPHISGSVPRPRDHRYPVANPAATS